MRAMKREGSFLIDLATSVLPVLAVYVLFRVVVILWPDWISGDTLLHFLGGASVAWMTYILWQSVTERKWAPALPTWLFVWTMLGTVAIVGVGWEFREWINDYLFGTTMQSNLTETMNDLGMDLTGGLCFIAITLLAKKKRP
jgi:hypothetical protein